MECEVCIKTCKQKLKVFVKGVDELYLCLNCVLRLPRENLEYCGEDERYRFKGNLRKN
ncbi:MAG: hypothetical protein ACYSU8_04335 [Planctomycetota bacterium]